MKKVSIILFICFVCFAGIQMYKTDNNPVTINIENELKIELDSLKPLPDDWSSGSSHFARKSNSVSVTKEYVSKNSYEDIKKYYNDELKKYNWQFSCEKDVKDWGKDLGGKELDYYKGQYSIEIFYSGEKANYGYTYGITIEWRNS